MPGGPLAIEWRADDHVVMTGPAEWEFSGTFDPATGAWAARPEPDRALGRSVAPGESVQLRLIYRITPRLQSGAFSARLAREAGVTSFGEWFPIVSRRHDSYGVGDPQMSFKADSIELRRDGIFLQVLVNGALYHQDTVFNLSSITVRGSGSPLIILRC